MMIGVTHLYDNTHGIFQCNKWDGEAHAKYDVKINRISMCYLSYLEPHSNIHRSGVKRLTLASGATKTRVRLGRLQLRCQHH
jgi:hypothetical protein